MQIKVIEIDKMLQFSVSWFKDAISSVYKSTLDFPPRRWLIS